jgi:hypothetical protein
MASNQDGQSAGGMAGMMGGDLSGLAGMQQLHDGNHMGGGDGGQHDANNALFQQQAFMAMAGGGVDAGASREALMSLLTKQG